MGYDVIKVFSASKSDKLYGISYNNKTQKQANVITECEVVEGAKTKREVMSKS